MTGNKTGGIVCCVIAALLFISGLVRVLSPKELEGPSSVEVSYAVGAFMPAVVMLIVGLWLMQPKKPKR